MPVFSHKFPTWFTGSVLVVTVLLILGLIIATTSGGKVPGMLAVAVLLGLALSGASLLLGRQQQGLAGGKASHNKSPDVWVHRLLWRGTNDLPPSLADLSGDNSPLPRTAPCDFPGVEDFVIRITGMAAVFRGPNGQGSLPVEETVASALRPGDLVLLEPGQVIPCAGEVIAGAGYVDESTTMGVSSAVFCEPGKEVTAGACVLSGCLILHVSSGEGRAMARPGHS